MVGAGVAQLGRLTVHAVAKNAAADSAATQIRNLAGVTDAEAGVPGKYADDIANRRINPQLESLDSTGGLSNRWAFVEGRTVQADEINQLHGAMRENIPPYKPQTVVVERYAEIGEKIYVVENEMQRLPGSWGAPTRYTSLERLRQELALLPEFKSGNLVIREYTVIARAPIREGIAGPQTSATNGGRYEGGGRQIEFLFDRGSVKAPSWNRFLSQSDEFRIQ
jgi:hypothetical protein